MQIPRHSFPIATLGTIFRERCLTCKSINPIVKVRTGMYSSSLACNVSLSYFTIHCRLTSLALSLRYYSPTANSTFDGWFNIGAICGEKHFLYLRSELGLGRNYNGDENFEGEQALRLYYFSYSTHVCMNFILLLNVEMTTIVGILKCISMINTTSES